MFGNNLQEVFEQNKKSHEHLIDSAKAKDIKEIDLCGLDFVRHLGAGSYGTVCLVKEKKTKGHLALKSINKKMINNMTALQLLKSEKEILSYVNFPLVVSLEGMHKGEDYIHFSLAIMAIA